jgi:EAL domain-containing protein (putative c-di-GMP-specific phosphodiesterase class I)
VRALGRFPSVKGFPWGHSRSACPRHLSGGFPVETLKIDRSFVEEMDRNSESVAIVRTIMGLGASLGLSVIAEGVERTAEAAMTARLIWAYSPRP